MRTRLTHRQAALKKKIAKRQTSYARRHVRLYHWMMNTEAWRQLRPASRALYVELAKLYNGANNGEIWLSVRDAARLINVNKDTAARCFKELEEKGFIRANLRGHFIWKVRHATTWILTEFDFGDELATKDFTRWPPSKEFPGPKTDPHCPKQGTDLITIKQLLTLLALGSGQGTWLCTVPRSRSEGHI